MSDSGYLPLRGPVSLDEGDDIYAIYDVVRERNEGLCWLMTHLRREIDWRRGVIDDLSASAAASTESGRKALSGLQRAVIRLADRLCLVSKGYSRANIQMEELNRRAEVFVAMRALV